MQRLGTGHVRGTGHSRGSIVPAEMATYGLASLAGWRPHR